MQEGLLLHLSLYTVPAPHSERSEDMNSPLPEKTSTFAGNRAEGSGASLR